MSIERENLKKNRKFGFTVGAVLIMISILTFLLKGNFNWSVGLSGLALSLLAAFFPRLLTPLEKSWLYLGLKLGEINSYILLTIIFVVIFIPIGLIMKAFRHDPLKKNFEPGKATYWEISSSENLADQMKYQF